MAKKSLPEGWKFVVMQRPYGSNVSGERCAWPEAEADRLVAQGFAINVAAVPAASEVVTKAAPVAHAGSPVAEESEGKGLFSKKGKSKE